MLYQKPCKSLQGSISYKGYKDQSVVKTDGCLMMFLEYAYISLFNQYLQYPVRNGSRFHLKSGNGCLQLGPYICSIIFRVGTGILTFLPSHQSAITSPEKALCINPFPEWGLRGVGIRANVGIRTCWTQACQNYPPTFNLITAEIGFRLNPHC